MTPVLEFADGVMPRRRRLPFVIAVTFLAVVAALGVWL